MVQLRGGGGKDLSASKLRGGQNFSASKLRVGAKFQCQQIEGRGKISVHRHLKAISGQQTTPIIFAAMGAVPMDHIQYISTKFFAKISIR